MGPYKTLKSFQGICLWILLSGIFFGGFYILTESIALFAAVPLATLVYRSWTGDRKLNPVLRWIYKTLGAGVIVQQLSVLYCLELIYFILHLEENVFKRYQIAYLCHTFSFAYALQQLPKWKLYYLYSYIYSTVITSTGFVGFFTCITFYLNKVSGSVLQNLDNRNFISLDGGFLIRFFTLFSLQAMAYYKADVDGGNTSHEVISRRFG